ncbi:hypothetical protein CC86DRAFT_365991 [Ophiobolus disseminans]|uniref:Zn(2)-C6 fungal-type domain-containing protein n=1 Tax=Ophiobolus disseminans TaxID=1469910 RepID=A0A6A7AHN0_9PLEO|nr:hypothetical protein CC86DRAFT_365991 [Ophiobolus disseminans]
MSEHIYTTSPMENWQDFVAWDGEFLDPIYTKFMSPQDDGLTHDYHLSESVTSEQLYLTSAPPSLADGTPSLDVSAPPSILDASSSFGQVYCTSPSFDTSPIIGGECYFGSFEACYNTVPPLYHSQESPILDTRYERIADSLPTTGSFEPTSESVLNPHVAGSSHSFSSLDVRASQIFTNIGTWTDQPQIIEPIAEADEYNTEAAPISIPYPQSQSFNGSFTSYPHSADFEQQRSRAVTIPQSKRRPASFNSAVAQSQWTQRVPPALSVSPIAHRRQRSITLSRSSSRTESRRKLPTPSPTSEGLGWVSYHLNAQTNRLTPTSTEGGQGRTPRGRKKGLTAEQRTHAALMRVIGACANCQKRKEKCDPGTPCRSCLEHYKGDLVNHPCRDRLLSDLAGTFLSAKWHPTARPTESFITPRGFSTLPATYTIPLYFGFGPELRVPVHALNIGDGSTHLHEHFVYSWSPPEPSTGCTHVNAVLPAILTKDASTNLMQTLDSHLSLLVSQHFRHFPLFCSPLRILRDVYVFYRSFPTGSSQSRTLHQALKLLVLVHIGGDITLPPPNSDATLSHLVQTTMESSDISTPRPCFIRSQFGKVMPGLALALMKEVLSSLEQLLLNRDCDDWPMTLAIMITVLMTIESIHYHGAKLPYHDSFDIPRNSTSDVNHGIDDEGVKPLLAFYTACFSGCHARLRPEWEGEAMSAQHNSSPLDTFVENVRGSIRKASEVGYLSRKATAMRQGEDMGYFFDRLVARLLLLKS